MKNGILYYYSLNVEEIVQKLDNYEFYVNDCFYILAFIKQNKNEIEQLFNMINNLDFDDFHKIIVNNKNELITMIDGVSYVLLKCNKKKDTICLYDTFSKSIKVNKDLYKLLDRTNWSYLWSKKIDYFEYQIEQFQDKYPIIKESFFYYVGLTENAIQFSSMISDSYISLSHKRIVVNMKELDYYNPLEIIIDYQVRDTSEYFKNKFFYSYLSFEEVIYYIDHVLHKEQLITFYTRMLYPSYYFDLYESIIEGKTKEKELLKVIRKTNDYEKFLKLLHKYISNKINIICLDWI